MRDDTQPKHPMYVVSKGRSKYMQTSRALTTMGIRHFIVVEPQEVDAYRSAVACLGLTADVIELDLGCKAKYELCDDLGNTRGTGPGPARNFAWQHSINSGARSHWVMDDNISAFYRLHENRKIKCVNPALFRAMEDFAANPQHTRVDSDFSESSRPATFWLSRVNKHSERIRRMRHLCQV